MCEILVGTSFVLQFKSAGSLLHSHGKEICTHLFYSQESEYLVICVHLLLIMITTINVQFFVDIYFVNLSPASVFTGAKLFMVL